MKPWKRFLDQQQQVFDQVCKNISREARAFDSIHHLETLGRKLCDRPLASERDLERYQSLANETPIADIIAYLKQSEHSRHEFNLGDGIIFENHLNTLSENDEEVQQTLEDLHNADHPESATTYKGSKQADQICVYKDVDGSHHTCLVVE